MATLAELRAQASAPPPRPKAVRTVTLVSGQHLLARSYALNEELLDLLVKAKLAEDEDETQSAAESRARVRKAAEGALPPRVEEIKAESAALVEELAQHQGEIGLVGIEGGEWHRFKAAHPPRPDNAVDLRLTGNSCNADDLFDSLGRFVATWDGEPVNDGEWDSWLAETICYADRRDLVLAVVEMYEETISRAPKSPRPSPETPSSGTD